MRFAVMLLVPLFLLLFSYALNAERSPLKGPTGRFLSAGRRDSSIKGPRRPHSPPASPKDEETCDTSKDYVEETVKSFTKIGLLGDQKLFLLDENEEFAAYCRKATKLLTAIDGELKCLDEEKKQFFSLLAKGYQKSVRKKCKSETWRKEYFKNSKCININDVEEEVQICSDKEYSALAYILKSIPEKDQTTVVCCYQPLVHECIRNQTAAVCGRKVGEFILDAFYEPRTFLIKQLCGGKFEEHCDEYTNALDRFDDIYVSESTETSKHDEIYNLFYKTVKNKFTIDEI